MHVGPLCQIKQAGDAGCLEPVHHDTPGQQLKESMDDGFIGRPTGASPSVSAWHSSFPRAWHRGLSLPAD